MKKIYIYEAEVLENDIKKDDTEINLVKLTRPEGLEEHLPKTGDIISAYISGNVYTMQWKIVGERQDDIYEIKIQHEIEYDHKYLIDSDFFIVEGLKCLNNLSNDISKEIKNYFPKEANTGFEISNYDNKNRLSLIV